MRKRQSGSGGDGGGRGLIGDSRQRAKGIVRVQRA